MYLKKYSKKTYFEEHLQAASPDNRFGPNTKEISIPENTFIWDKKDVIFFTWYSKS